jgi:uncharacterized delta-60 repeat protein
MRTARAAIGRAVGSGALVGVLAAACPAGAQEPASRITAPFFRGVGVVAAVAIQPDGRIVAAGTVPPADGSANTDFGVMRLLPDGRPDPGFGLDGLVRTDFGRQEQVRAITIQPDGRIVVAGLISTPVPVQGVLFFVVALARYMSDGSLDPTFSGDGLMAQATWAPTPQWRSYDVRAVAVAPSDEILVDVIHPGDTLPEFYELQRFSSAGVQLESWGAIDLSLNSIQPFAFDGTGRVTVLGTNDDETAGRLTRYTPAGALDTSFNGSGRLDGIRGNAIAAHGDGRVVVASAASISRLTAVGAPDVAFGSAGAIAVAAGANAIGELRAVAIAPDHTVVAAGRRGAIQTFPEPSDFTVVAADGAGRLLLDTWVDFGGYDLADTVAVVGRDVVAAGRSLQPLVGWTIAWTRVPLTGWRPVPGMAVSTDWDGDRRSDMIVHERSGTWHIAGSSGAFGGREAYRWGAPADVPVAADFDGNGRLDLAVYRVADRTWHTIEPAGGFIASYQWGMPGDLPVPGDYDGDGRSEVAVFRPRTGEWLTCDVVTGYYGAYRLGQGGDVPLPRDYDGDGRTDLAVYTPGSGIWQVFNVATGVAAAYQWGAMGDIPVPADYLGTGELQIAVYRPSTGTWWIFDPATGKYFAVSWGTLNDVPVPGDYIGDRRTELAVWRPSTGAWFVWDLGTGSWTGVELGAPQ